MVGVNPDLVRRIGSNIERARTRAGLTIAQLAATIGMSAEALTAIEAGDLHGFDNLSLTAFLAASRAVGTSARQILRED